MSWSKAPRVARLFAVATVLAACAPPLEHEWQLRRFRILGVHLDRPEARPGETVTATLATGVPEGTPMNSLDVFWQICASRTSTGQCGAGSPPPIFAPTATFTVPANITTVDDSNAPVVSMFGYACWGGSLRMPDSTYPLPRCLGGSDRFPAVGYLFQRNVMVVPPRPINPVPNSNPEFTEVRFGPSPPMGMMPPAGTVVPITLEAPPHVPRCATGPAACDTTAGMAPRGCPRYRFELGFTPASREVYISHDPSRTPPDRMRTEQIEAFYMVDCGWLAGSERGDNDVVPMSPMINEFIAPAVPPTGGVINVWIVAYDGRGGMTYTQRRIIVD